MYWILIWKSLASIYYYIISLENAHMKNTLLKRIRCFFSSFSNCIQNVFLFYLLNFISFILSRLSMMVWWRSTFKTIKTYKRLWWHSITQLALDKWNTLELRDVSKVWCLYYSYHIYKSFMSTYMYLPVWNV